MVKRKQKGSEFRKQKGSEFIFHIFVVVANCDHLVKIQYCPNFLVGNVILSATVSSVFRSPFGLEPNPLRRAAQKQIFMYAPTMPNGQPMLRRRIRACAKTSVRTGTSPRFFR